MKLWLDTDPGVDDALALALILARPEFELVGLSTVFGNASVAQTTRNALRLLALFGRPAIPVHAGAAQPLQGQARYAAAVHGEDGLSGFAEALPPPLAQARSLDAATALVAASQAHPGLQVAAVGPLTNIALALRLDPMFPRRIAGLTVMGAAFGSHGFTGNVTPCAEANIHNDARAAAEVFAAPWRTLRVIGLDATQRTRIPVPALQPLRSATPVSALLWQALQPYAGYYETRDGEAALVAHDATAVAALLLPEAFAWRSGPVRVVEGGLAHGQTVQDWQRLSAGDPDWDTQPHHQAAVDADLDALSRLCLAAWTTL